MSMTCLGTRTSLESAEIPDLCVTDDCLCISKPVSSQTAARPGSTKKAYLESI